MRKIQKPVNAWSGNVSPTTVLAIEKNKKRIVPSQEVTKSDLTIEFNVIYSVENEVRSSYIYLRWINYVIIINQNSLKIEVFFDDVISGQDDVTAVQFSMEDQISGWSFGKKNFGWIGSTSCLLNLLIDTLLFKFQPLKKPTF